MERWLTANVDNMRCHIATEDMDVFKLVVVRRTSILHKMVITSPQYQQMKFKLNKIYKRRLRLNYIGGCLYITNGLHCDYTLEVCQYFKILMEEIDGDKNDYRIFKAIIPEGSIFYKDNNNIITNQLKLTEEYVGS